MSRTVTIEIPDDAEDGTQISLPYGVLHLTAVAKLAQEADVKAKQAKRAVQKTREVNERPQHPQE